MNTFLRITSSNQFDTSVAQLQRRQQDLTEAQTRLTSGKRVRQPGDDPAAAAAAERAGAAIARADASQRALDASRNAMQLTESALGDAGELLQQARELIVAAGNGSYSDRDREILGEALEGLRSDLLNVANRGDGTGRYLFGGQGSSRLPPLVDELKSQLERTGFVTYQGTAGQAQAAAGEASPLAFDGSAVWQLPAAARAPEDPRRNVFEALFETFTALTTEGQDAETVATKVREGLANLDAGAANLSRWRARAGESLNRIDGIGERLAQSKLDAQEQRSTAEDLDMVAAISDFQNRQSGYDAALKTYSIVQKMSLFDYIR